MALANTSIFDPRAVSVIFADIILERFAADNIATITPLGGGIVRRTGADGEASISLDPDRGYEVTLTFAQGSPSIQLLQAFYEAFRLAGQNGTATTAPMTVRNDSSGIELFTTGCAWVVNSAARTFAREETDVEFTLQCDRGLYIPAP